MISHSHCRMQNMSSWLGLGPESRTPTAFVSLKIICSYTLKKSAEQNLQLSNSREQF